MTILQNWSFSLEFIYTFGLFFLIIHFFIMKSLESICSGVGISNNWSPERNEKYETKKHSRHFIPNRRAEWHSTILQKLSKCEVNARLCWNLIILLPLWFCVKHTFEIGQLYHHFNFTWNQILVNSNGPKVSFFAILETLNLQFW